MESGKNQFQGPALRLLVLVPHRDARLPLREWSASLFSAGLEGAWSFPWAAPVAALKRPLAEGELKRLARSLRQEVNLAGGKFIAGLPAALPVHAGRALYVYGPSLNLELPEKFFEPGGEAVICGFSPLLIGSAILHGPLPGRNPYPAPPQLSFRAAALANMAYSPLHFSGGDGFSFEWEIEALHWLPKALPKQP